jgi:hypothetical protein
MSCQLVQPFNTYISLSQFNFSYVLNAGGPFLGIMSHSRRQFDCRAVQQTLRFAEPAEPNIEPPVNKSPLRRLSTRSESKYQLSWNRYSYVYIRITPGSNYNRSQA